MKQVVLADNQDITRYGMGQLALSLGADCKLARGKEELVGALMEWPEAVVVLDYTLFDLASADELLVLFCRFPSVGWLLFSDELSIGFLRKVLLSVANAGVMMKDVPLAELEEAIRTALDGRRFVGRQVESLLSGVFVPEETQEKLTPTENEILKAIALGRSSKEIATERFLSVHTVMTHRKNIFRKLHVNNAHEATRYAMRAGIVNLAEYCI